MEWLHLQPQLPVLYVPRLGVGCGLNRASNLHKYHHVQPGAHRRQQYAATGGPPVDRTAATAIAAAAAAADTINVFAVAVSTVAAAATATPLEDATAVASVTT